MNNFCTDPIIGHRFAPISLLSALENTVEKHISHFHVDEFIIGRYGDFDHMAAQAVKNVKRQHPGIRLTMLLAYYNPQKPTPLTEGFDDSLFPEGLEFVPKRYAIMKANLYMVKHCDYLITYDKGIVGNTRIIVEKAQREQAKGHLTITNLAKCGNQQTSSR